MIIPIEENKRNEIEENISNQAPVVKMSLFYDNKTGYFNFQYTKDDKIYFNVVQDFEHFERMTSDMIRMVKEYNLMQAKEFKEKVENLSPVEVTYAADTQTYNS